VGLQGGLVIASFLDKLFIGQKILAGPLLSIWNKEALAALAAMSS